MVLLWLLPLDFWPTDRTRDAVYLLLKQKAFYFHIFLFAFICARVYRVEVNKQADFITNPRSYHYMCIYY